MMMAGPKVVILAGRAVVPVSMISATRCTDPRPSASR
jgi:hypothetical protein